VDWFGVQQLFISVPLYAFQANFWPIAATIWQDLVAGDTAHNYDLQRSIIELGEILSNKKTPWINRREIGYEYFEEMVFRVKLPLDNIPNLIQETNTENPQILFGTFVLAAIMSEGNYDKTNAMMENAKEANKGLLTSIKAMIRSRYETNVNGEIDLVNFNPFERELVIAWSKKTINFTR
jgi:hypothetical protein